MVLSPSQCMFWAVSQLCWEQGQALGLLQHFFSHVQAMHECCPSP